ncbi:MAG: anhydro-N-acetylmuramic acid kinase [Bacteroidetes bacterium]|nr:anhydro-N-acetylmuramic acid kinase [Bacteroidota bacterium]
MNIQELEKLSRKKTKLVIGLMSGTSLDGVDVVLVKIENSGTRTRINQIGFITYPFPLGVKKRVLDNSSVNSGNVTDICKLNFLIPLIYVDAIKSLCKKAKVPLNKIDLIGSHGQTIHHLPAKEIFYGYKFGSTLQIADPMVIAKLTGIPTIGDFRTGDVALGGEGAPLVPYFDYLLFHSKNKNRALLNIGGISNITVLNKNFDATKVLAFDTGPGNMMIDIAAKKFFNKEYDKNGLLASSGKIDEKLFYALIKKDNFVEKKIPKSTGREYYGKEFLSPLFKRFKKVPKVNWITTIATFTAYGVFRNYEKFVKGETEIEELFVSGGGYHNKFLMKSLQKYFGKNVEVKNVESLGISSDAKEAICFAVLANETLSGNPSNIPRVTGASKATILGKICLP